MSTTIVSKGRSINAILKVHHNRYELSLANIENKPDIAIYDTKTHEMEKWYDVADFNSLKQAMAKIEELIADLTQIAVWPDGDWCEATDVEEYMRDLGKSDDYEVREITPAEFHELLYTTTAE